jgi:hypothetical protein
MERLLEPSEAENATNMYIGSLTSGYGLMLDVYLEKIGAM